MAIRLQSLRIKGFRGFRNIEIDFENLIERIKKLNEKLNIEVTKI